MKHETVFIPGQLVRLRYHWDDIDDDVEFPADEIRPRSPAYYAHRDTNGFKYDAILPGQVGLFLAYGADSSLAIVLFDEQKYGMVPEMLEIYNGQK